MIFWNNKEEAIIGAFLNQLEQYENEAMLLQWDDGSQILAQFDSYIEDENDFDMDDANYEEFWSIVFNAINVNGHPTCDNYQFIFRQLS